MTSLSWLGSLRFRLSMAFASAAVITAVGSLVALYELTSIGGIVTDIASDAMPATIQSLRLAEETTGLIASAPRLMMVTDELQRSTVAAGIADQAQGLAARFERLHLRDGSPTTEIDAAQGAMIARFDTLNRAVTERITLADRRQAMLLAVRKSHEALLEAIIPAVDDANFDLMTASKATDKATASELLESLQRLLEVEAEANLLTSLLAEASLVSDIARMNPLRDRIDAAQSKIAAKLGGLTKPEQRKKLTELYDRLGAMAGKDGVIALRNRELTAQRSAELAFVAAQSEAIKLKEAVDRLVVRQSEIAQAVAERAQEQIHSGRILLVALSGAAFALAIISGYYVLRAVTRPLRKLVAVMDVVRQGDFTGRLDVGRRDEFGVLAEGFNRMADEVKALVGDVYRSGIQVSTSVTEIAATSKQQQATASEIAATTTEVGATSREISATSKQLAKTMEEVSSVAEQTATLATEGQTGLSRMRAVMDDVMGAAGSIAVKLDVLNANAGNINQVVLTITKVADQTNLLSLNAAIEAEKAGEYGRGCAVVASEIRRLADQTAVATYDIEQIVKEIQSSVTASVMGMEKFSENVLRGKEEVQQVGSHLSEIIQQVQGLVPSFETVNEGMQAQSEGAEQIAEGLLQLTDAVQQTAESLRQSTIAIDELNQVSGNLRSSVSRFKLEAA